MCPVGIDAAEGIAVAVNIGAEVLTRWIGTEEAPKMPIVVASPEVVEFAVAVVFLARKLGSENVLTGGP